MSFETILIYCVYNIITFFDIFQKHLKTKRNHSNHGHTGRIMLISNRHTIYSAFAVRVYITFTLVITNR